MAQFEHPNIVALTGVCTLPTTEPTLIVLEYMHLGSLHGYLQSPMVKDQLEELTMLRMALDVAAAMQYLAESGFVVRRACGVALYLFTLCIFLYEHKIIIYKCNICMYV